MERKHFETATIGAREARALLKNEDLHGALVATKVVEVRRGSLFGDTGIFEELTAVFADGFETPVPWYAGETPERIRKIATLEWGEEADWPNRIPQEEVELSKDRVGAVVEV